MEVIQDSTHPHLYRIKYDDGSVSEGMWNKTRATEHIKLMEIEKASEVKNLEALMEQLANAPKEEMGKRMPGERNAYEIQRSTEDKHPRKATEKPAGALKSKTGTTLADNT